MFGTKKRPLVSCELEHIELENEDGLSISSVCVTCGKCGHETESFGTGQASITRCLALMRNECPELENNYYVTDEEE